MISRGGGTLPRKLVSLLKDLGIDGQVVLVAVAQYQSVKPFRKGSSGSSVVDPLASLTSEILARVEMAIAPMLIQ